MTEATKPPMPDTTKDQPRTFVERYNYWRCPDCGTWDDGAECPGCAYKRVNVARVVYECQRCFCFATDISMHDCETCPL